MVDSLPKGALPVDSSEAGWADDLDDLDLENEPVTPVEGARESSDEASDGWGEDDLDNLDCSTGDGETKNLIVPLDDRPTASDKTNLFAQATNDDSTDAVSGWDDFDIDDVDLDELDGNQAVDPTPEVAHESTGSTSNESRAPKQAAGEMSAVDSAEAETPDAKESEDLSGDGDQPVHLSSTVAPAAVRLLETPNESKIPEDSNKIPQGFLKTAGDLSACEPSHSIVPEDSRLFDQVQKVHKTKALQVPVAALPPNSLEEGKPSRTKTIPQEDKALPNKIVKPVGAAAPTVTANSHPRIRRHTRPDEEARYKAELERSVDNWVRQVLASNNDSVSDVPCFLYRYVSRAREARRRAGLLNMPSLDS